MAEPRRRLTVRQRAAHARQDRALFLWQVAGKTWQAVADSEDPAMPGTRLYETAATARIAGMAALERAGGTEPAEPPTTSGEPPPREPGKRLTLDEARDELHARWDALVRTYMPRAATGDVKAAKVVHDALAAQANLRGAFTRPAPARPADPGGEGDVVDQLAEQRARRRGAGRAAPTASTDAT